MSLGKLHLWGTMNPKVVELATLVATCLDLSGMVHKYKVMRTSKTRVLLTYTNPDEYGAWQPISCYLPCYDQDDSCWVVLDPTSYRNVGPSGWEYDPHQAFSGIWFNETWTNPNEKLTPEQIQDVYDGREL